MTPGASTGEGSRVGLNVALWVAVVLCGALAIFGAVVLASDDDPASSRVSTRAGERIGDARVKALPMADRSEQERTAEVIDAATKMANAFLNLDHEDAEASTEAVKSLATGPFLSQYEKSTKSLIKIANRAKAVQKGEVVWAGVVAADEDSATVLVASSGSVANKTTDFKAVPRNYRLQLDLVREGEAWLTRDLQFVQ